MNVDKLLEQVGGFGIFQKQQYLLLCLPTMFSAMHQLAWVFLGATPAHRCKLEMFNSSLSPEEILNISVPWDYSENTWSKCKVYNTSSLDVNTSATIPCKQWEYDDSEFIRTVVMDWDLVCHRSWLQATSQASFMAGILFACVVIGVLADRFGRIKIFLWSTFFMALSGILTILAPEITLFCILRGVTGASQCGLFYTAFVLVTELVGPSSRAAAGLGVMCFYAIGYLILALLAYFIRNWVNLQLAISCPLILFLTYWWFVPESIRWLVAKQHFHEAESILKLMAKKNNIPILSPIKWKITLETKSESCKNKLQLFSVMLSTRILIINLILFFISFTNGLLYFGLSLSILNLDGNNFINFAIGGAVEIPACLISSFAMNKFGRRKSLCFCLTIGGIVFLSTAFVNKNMFILLVTLNMIGRLLCTGSSNMTSVFSSELYPTVIRMVGLGLSNVFSRLGGLIAPFFLLLHGLILPITFGVLSLVAGFLILILPETLNKTLPDSLQDVKDLYRERKICPTKLLSEVVTEKETSL